MQRYVVVSDISTCRPFVLITEQFDLCNDCGMVLCQCKGRSAENHATFSSFLSRTYLLNRHYEVHGECVLCMNDTEMRVVMVTYEARVARVAPKKNQ